MSGLRCWSPLGQQHPFSPALVCFCPLTVCVIGCWVQLWDSHPAASHVMQSAINSPGTGSCQPGAVVEDSGHLVGQASSAWRSRDCEVRPTCPIFGAVRINVWLVGIYLCVTRSLCGQRNGRTPSIHPGGTLSPAESVDTGAACIALTAPSSWRVVTSNASPHSLVRFD